MALSGGSCVPKLGRRDFRRTSMDDEDMRFGLAFFAASSGLTLPLALFLFLWMWYVGVIVLMFSPARRR